MIYKLKNLHIPVSSLFKAQGTYFLPSYSILFYSILHFPLNLFKSLSHKALGDPKT